MSFDSPALEPPQRGLSQASLAGRVQLPVEARAASYATTRELQILHFPEDQSLSLTLS
jgi:hypothetical protein